MGPNFFHSFARFSLLVSLVQPRLVSGAAVEADGKFLIGKIFSSVCKINKNQCKNKQQFCWKRTPVISLKLSCRMTAISIA